MDQISIGYLSWKKREILEKTLQSHQDNELFDYINPENRTIFFQEISEEDVSLAKKFNCNYIGNENNIGIMEAYIQLVNNCRTKYFIFCENDFLLLENSEEYNIRKCLEDLVEILEEFPFSQVKLSNYKKPGFLYITPSDGEKWMLNDNRNFRYKVESFSWLNCFPNEYYTNIEIINKRNLWYKVKHEDQNWSNHIYACNVSFLKEIVIPILESSKKHIPGLDIKYQGLEESLIHPEKLLGISSEIDDLVNKFKTRCVISGGGNFYHNKT